MAKKTSKTKAVSIPLMISLQKGNFTSVMNEIKKDLANAQEGTGRFAKQTTEGLNKVVKTLEVMQSGFDRVSDINSNSAKEIKSNWISVASSIESVAKTITKDGLPVVERTAEKMTSSFDRLRMEVDRTETAFTKLGRTIVNSLRYQVVNSALDAIVSSFQGTMDYFEKVDENLTNISIVSGKTNEELQGFVKTAQSYGKALGSLTNEYLQAAEFFYQQGLSSNEVLERTNATIQAANISGQSVTDTANQMTAVLNGFDIAASETTVVLDKMAALGAGTATDFEEIATAVQKVASAASEAGVGLDETLAMISTISSVTREAPESVGTSLNSIISRMNNLTVAEKDNIDSYTSQVQRAYESVNAGLTIFDGEGLIKDRALILSELADKWAELDKNQQATITTALAGTRQANKLYALLGNWSEYENYLSMSQNSEGALEEQNNIYLQSYEAIKNQTKLIQEEIWGNIFDTDLLKDFHEGFLQPILRVIESITKNIGGWQGLITPMLALVREPLTSIITPHFANKTFRKTLSDHEAESLESGTRETNERLKVLNMRGRDASGTTVFNQLLDKEVKLLSHKDRQRLSPEQDAQYVKEIRSLEKIVALREEILDLVNDVEEIGKTKSKTMGATDQIKMYQSIFGETSGKQDRLRQFNNLSSDFSKGNNVNKVRGAMIAEIANQIGPENEEAQRELENLAKKSLPVEEIVTLLDKFVKDVDAIEAARDRALGEISADQYEKKANLVPILQGIAATGNPDFLSGMQDSEYKQNSKGYNAQYKYLQQLLKSPSMSGVGKEVISSTDGSFSFQIEDLFKTSTKAGKENAAKIAEQILSDSESQRIWQEILEIFNDNMPPELTNLAEKLKQVAQAEKDQAEASKRAAAEAEKREAAAKTARNIELAGKAFLVTSAAMTTYNIVSDKTLSTQEKVAQSSGQLLSVVGSLIPKTMPLVGMGFQIAGMILPALIKQLGIGVPAFERLAKATQKAVDAQNALTQGIKAQRTLLASAETAYSSLAKAYQDGSLNVANLTEEQQSMYDQAIEYITNYNPELIKGYTAEGKAILDLSKSYKDLENNMQGYLTTSLNVKENEMYKQFSDSASTNAGSVYKTQNAAMEEARRLEEEIFKLRQKSTLGLGDYSTELSTLEQKLADTNAIVQNSGANWNELVTKPITLSNIAFSSLDANIQNTVNQLASFSSFVGSSLSQDNFIEQTKSLVYALGDASVDTKKKLEEMSDTVRAAMFAFTMSSDMDSNMIGAMFESTTESSFLGGDFLTETIGRIKQGLEEVTKDGRQRVQELKAENVKLANANIEVDSLETKQLFDETSAQLKANQVEIARIEQAFLDLATVEENVLANWRDSMVEVAMATNEGFNAIVGEFRRLRDELSQGITLGGLSESEISSYQERMGALYTALNADNEEFFGNWRQLNSKSISKVESDWGVSAKNYRTYAEYKLAIDEALAKKKVLLSALATGDELKIKEAQANFEKEVALQRLEVEGLTNHQVAASYANAGKVKELVDTQVAIHRLTELKAGLQGELEAAKAGAQISQDVAVKYIKDINEVGAAGETIIEALGGEVALSAYNGTFEAFATDALEEIEKQIVTLTEKKETMMSDTSGSVVDGKSINDLLGTELGESINNFISSLKLPNFEDIIDPSQYEDIELKVTPKPNNEVNNGSGGGSEKEVSDLSFDIDPLKPYQDKIDSINVSLGKTQKLREKLYGKAYLDALKKESDLNKELLVAEEAKLKKARELAQSKKGTLSAGGVKFNVDGTIANYNEILIGLENATNALTGEQKEASSKAAEEFKKLMDEYEEYGLDVVRASEEAIAEIKVALAEAARESIEYPIKLILDESELDKKVFDFLNGISKLENGEIKISFEGSTNLEKLSNAMNTLGEIFSLGDGTSFLNSVTNNPDLAGDPAKQREMIQTQMDNMMGLGEELTNLVETMDKSFNDGLGAAMSSLAEEIAKFNNITIQHQRILEITKALNTTTMADINSTYEAVESIYRQNLGAQQTLAQQMKSARDEFEVGSESWLTANNKYLEAQKNVLETEKQLAELLSSKYDDTAAAGRRSLEGALFNGSTSKQALKDLEAMTKEKEKYLDVQDEVYELSKFERDIQKDIASLQGNPKAQAALRKFQDSELDYLRNKEKITKTDLELSQKQYDIFKARIDLEKAQQGGSMELMLQRNADGSFGYMYVKNMEEADAAAQKYEDSVNDLYDFSVNKIADLQKEAITIRDEALNEYDSIVADLKAGIIDVATAEAKLGKVFEKVNEDLTENARLQKEMEQQAVSAQILQILGAGGANANLTGPLSTSLSSVFDVLGSSGGTALADVIEKLGYSTGTFVGTTGEQMAQLFEELGGDDGAMATLINMFAEANDSTSATILGLLKETGDLAAATEAMLDASLVGSGEAYDEYIAKISADSVTPEELFTQTITEGLTSVQDLWTSMSGIIKADLDALAKEFDITNTEGILSKVTTNLTTAYTDYNTALTDSLTRLKNEQAELKAATDTMTTALQGQVDKIGAEIVSLTNLEKAYQGVRDNVLLAIEATGEYIEELETGLGKVANASVEAMKKVDGQIETSTSRMNTAKQAIVDTIAAVTKAIEESKGAQTPDPSSPNGNNSGGRVITPNRVQHAGSKAVTTVQAFHTGGKVDVNKEGYALLKKNEAVITEQQAKVIAQVRDMANSMMSSQSVLHSSNGANNNTVVNMSFPNVVHSNEIIEAFEGLSVMAQQKVKKN